MVRVGTLGMCGSTEWWPPGCWPDEREEGAHATSDGSSSVPLLVPGPQRLGGTDCAMCWCCPFCSVFACAGRSTWQSLVDEGAQQVQTL